MSLTTYPFTDLGSVARASAKRVLDATGAWTELAQNTLPLGFGTDLLPRGAWIEELRTNTCPNPRPEGSVNGTPGTLPTGWNYDNTGGLTTTVVGTGTMRGLPFIDVRLNGTSTGTFTVLRWMTGVAASAGQVWTSSAFLALVGGSTANITNIGVGHNVTGGTGTVEVFYSLGALSASAWQRREATSTMGAGAATVAGRLAVYFSAGVAIDITLRIAVAQTEQGAFASSPILPPPGVPAATTRAQEVINVPLASALWSFSAIAGTIIAEFEVPQSAPAGAPQTVLALGASDTDRLIIRNAAGGDTVQAVSHVGGTDAVTLALGTGTPGAVQRVVLGYSGAGLRASRNGGAIVSSGTPHAAGLLTGNAMLGRGLVGGGQFLNGYLRDVLYVPRLLADGDITALSNTANDARALLAALA